MNYIEGPYSVLEKEVDRYPVGFVKAEHTFIVTDNLEIMPLTTNESVNVLKKLNVDSLADLEGNDITVSLTQVTNSQVLTCRLLMSAMFARLFPTPNFFSNQFINEFDQLER